jgi:hypothetical protein
MNSEARTFAKRIDEGVIYYIGLRNPTERGTQRGLITYAVGWFEAYNDAPCQDFTLGSSGLLMPTSRLDA